MLIKPSKVFVDIRGVHDHHKLIGRDPVDEQIINNALNEARRVLRERRDILERVTRRLLEKEVMEGDELREIMRGNPEPTPEPAPTVNS